MSPELKSAVEDRIKHGYSKEQIEVELKNAGYDDASIVRIYQSALSGEAVPSTSIPTPVAVKKTLSPWLIAFAPVIFFILLIILWGIINLLAAGSDSGIFAFVNSVLVPILLGLSFLAVPICIIVALVVAHRRYDGVIRCGNCNYNGPGESGRSVWAQILAWAAFLIFWPITLAYYLITHRYRCPQCKSTFIGMRDKQGHYTAAGKGLGGVVVVIIVIFVIAIIGILSAVVLASINDAREAAEDAAERQRSAEVPRIPVVDFE